VLWIFLPLPAGPEKKQLDRKKQQYERPERMPLGHGGTLGYFPNSYEWHEFNEVTHLEMITGFVHSRKLQRSCCSDLFDSCCFLTPRTASHLQTV